MRITQNSEGFKETFARWGTILLVLSVAGILLAGCTFYSHNGPRMMGNNSNYYSSKVACNAPANLPGQLVSVDLGDMGMNRMMGGRAPLGSHMRLLTVPSTISGGQTSIVVTNLGWRTHELVIMPLPDGQSAGQRVPGSDGKIDETGSVAEASNNCGAGVGDGVRAGAVTWTTVTLKPGRYEFLCNLPNHYADGMYQEVTVTAS